MGASMELSELLPPEQVVVPLSAPDLRTAVEALVEVLAARGVVRGQAQVTELAAEASTRDMVAISEDVALPHYRTDDVDRLAVALGLSPEPLEGGEELGISPRIVVLVLAPRDASSLYLQAVSALARVLREPAVVRQLLEARTPEEVVSVPGLTELRIQPRLTVRDIMLHRVDSVDPETDLREAIRRMVERDLRSLPVVGEKGEVLGLLTERDAMRALMPQVPRAGEDAPQESALSGQLVRDVMSRSVLCISEDMGVDEVANTMLNKDVDQVPVVSQGRLSGVLTRGQIIRKLFPR